MEERIAALEKEVADLKRQLGERQENSKEFILDTIGEAMQKKLDEHKFYVEKFEGWK